MPPHRTTALTDEQTSTPQTPRQRPRRPRGRFAARLAAPAVVAASVLAGAALTSGPAPEAEAAVPDRLLQAAQAERQLTTSAAWFDQVGVRAAADERVAAEEAAAKAAREAAARAAEEAAAAEAARLAEEARQQAAAEATRNAQRDPKGIARIMVADRGWNEGQFSCLDSLWTKESGWDYSAANPTSSAYGIPQALPGRKMSSAGADWETNPVTQISWGLTYIESRYGSPCSAWSHSKSHNWY
ncbi:lytic transglycosylase domain-containing protein [Kineococcus sp. LSe6-4]|uniref:Lytic transglycosylase domain-containing protein n=1 Tax=Kineococcus halophytocola TaxID=3234027 RepID=A0ABV4GZ87_9ACTN